MFIGLISVGREKCESDKIGGENKRGVVRRGGRECATRSGRCVCAGSDGRVGVAASPPISLASYDKDL